MVLLAFAGLNLGGVVRVEPAASGTRAEDAQLISVMDEVQTSSTEGDADSGAFGTGIASTFARAEANVPGDFDAQNTEEARRDTTSTATRGDASTGTISVERVERTGTRGHLPPGIADAGGPYGGADTFEGTDITFRSEVFDPSLIFVRWDLNGDGKWDFPDQTGCPQPGCFTTSLTGVHSFTRHFNDNTPFDLPQNVVVEWWDGVSIIVIINSDANLVPRTTTVSVRTTFRNTGWYFTAKVNMEVTQLHYFKQLSTDVYIPFMLALWDVTTQTMLGSCIPPQTGVLVWNSCTLTTPINLQAGQDYIVAGHKGQTATQNWANENKNPVDRPKVLIKGRYADNGAFGNWPGTNDFSADANIPKVDFTWRETVLQADGAQDVATLEIHNVAPQPFGITTMPSPALEGSPAGHVASFSDPGLDDTWRYRFTSAAGSSAWLNVIKVNGGARVLLLDTYSNDATWTNLATNPVLKACGSFCVSAERFDFGPLGTPANTLPSLAYLTSFDVVIVGVNFAHTFAVPLGNLLASYMDAAGPAGGGVIMLQGALDNRATFGVMGRWQSELYSPIPVGTILAATSALGQIYVPGHPFLDGIITYSSGLRVNVVNTQGTGVRIADYVDGRIAMATNTNPNVANGARACVLPMFPVLGFTTGPVAQVLANAIRYCSRQVDPTPKTMPLLLDPVNIVYKDDDPTSVTPQDDFLVSVEVMDDDHAPPGVMLFRDDMESGPGTWTSASLWHLSGGCVPGNSPANAWRFNVEPACTYATGATVAGSLTLSASVNPLGVSGLQLEFWGWQETENGATEGQTFDQRWVELSTNNGGSWTIVPWGPAGSTTALSRSYQRWYRYTFDISAYSTASSLLVRFRFNSGDSVLNAFRGWFIDDVRIGSPVPPNVVNGVGSADGSVTIANVPPLIGGGFADAFRLEGQTLEFKGFTIQDPALFEPTEQFSWAMDLGDGSPLVDGGWHNLGSLAPRRSSVLVIHTLCNVGLGGGCPFFQGLQTALLASDTVSSVAGWNYIDNNGAGGIPTAPALSLMLQFDVIIVSTNFAYLAFPPFNLARQQVGDRLADYVDAGRGGVLTTMAVYDVSATAGDVFSLLGRYIEDDYGAFEKTTYDFVAFTALGVVYDSEHPLFDGVGTAVATITISPGDMPVTASGRGQASGVAGTLLADWPDGGSAIGAKELLNGERTAHIGVFWPSGPAGSGGARLLRNAIGWISGGLPSPKIPAFSHVYGDNGVYTVDLMVLDDDMGMLLGAPGSADAPSPAPSQTGAISHRFLTVSIDNDDPVIVKSGIEAFIAAEVCLRVSGTAGNTVTVGIWADGALSSSVSVLRIGGNPNPPTEKCGLLKVDMLSAHSFAATISYSAPAGGTNPSWLIIEPWRNPVTPGHGTVTIDIDPARTSALGLPTLKRDLLAGGEGAVVDFAISASDAGTDDLAVMWWWNVLGNADRTIHVFHNNGLPRTNGVLAPSDLLGFSEPHFDRAANTGLSALGTPDFRIRDTANHGFNPSNPVHYVFVGVFDDDNGRGYPSEAIPDGTDVAIIVLYLWN
ncbi:MAG TPA: DUF4082 domain-containing protein [Thermoplasmata archaeon]|nr:DUF4082 domain-containing protein [Thermoplasmata archaeon]